MKYMPITQKALYFEFQKCYSGHPSLPLFLVLLDTFHQGILNVLFLSFGPHNLLGVKKNMTHITRIYEHGLCTTEMVAMLESSSSYFVIFTQ